MGRGDYYRWNRKTTTAELLSIRMADLKKHKCNIPEQQYSCYWSRNGERFASVSFTVTESSITFNYSTKTQDDKPLDVSKTVPLTVTSCYFGGHRKWFLCGCGRKVARIFIRRQHIACRRCFNAVYPSQNEDVIMRQWGRINKLEAKLKDDRQRPKGMHWKTYFMLQNELHKAYMKKEEVFCIEARRRFPGMEM